MHDNTDQDTCSDGDEAVCPAPDSDPKWLTAEEQEAWLAASAMMLLLPPVLDAQLQHDAGITMFEYFVLSALSMAPERVLGMSDLALFTNGSLSRLSNVMKKLEQRGWVTRSVAATSRRCTNAQLTPAGYEVVIAAAPGHVALVRKLLIDPLTEPEVRTLASIGKRIVRRIRPRID